MLDKSAYTKFSDDQVKRFEKQLKYAKDNGQIDAKENKRMKMDFRRNQNRLKYSQ